MHLGEALMTHDEATALARAELAAIVRRNAAYYAKIPERTPEPARDLRPLLRCDDLLIYVSFGRRGSDDKPFVMRVNGVTKAVSPENGL